MRSSALQIVCILSLGLLVEVACIGSANAVVTAPTLPPAATTVNDLPAHDATVGTMVGQAGTDGGAATYNVPIVIPPGRAGMQPNLALSYNSRSGNGVMGLGWSISGLSSIHRCPQTSEQDAQMLGVSYAGTDKLCLDGQRLVVVAGTYGASGAEYRTEVDSYARVLQTGGGLTGATTCFRVEQKDGRILHYGAVTSGSPVPTSCATSPANARVQPGSATSTLSWLVEKIEDRVGNNQLYAYTAVGNGENLIRTITYTGFGAAVGDRVVTFNYETRATASSTSSDLASSYLAGGMTMQTQALASVVTSVAASTVRTYTPAYTTAAYSGRLLMSTMTECATNTSGTNCHPATQFAYNDGTLSYPFKSLSGAALPSTLAAVNPYQVNVIGDLDGDGAREAAASVAEADGIHVFLVQMKGDRTLQNAVDLSGTGFSTVPERYAEIDGSGRSALIEPPASTGVPQVISFGIWNYSLYQRGATVTSNPLQTFASAIPYAYGAGTGSSGSIYAADVNGDGKTDIIVTAPSASCGSDAWGSKNGVFVYKNTMTGTLETQSAASMFQAPSGPLFCLTRTPSGNAFQEQRIDHIADFDGNGLPDFYLVLIDATTGRTTFSGVTLTNAGGTSATAKSCTQIGLVSDGANLDDECNWYNGYATRWMDVNGDGLEDFVIARANQGTWQVRLNQGNGLLGSVITPTGSATFGLDNYNASTPSGKAFRYANSLPAMDVDADGKPDLLVPSQTQGVHGFAVKTCTMYKVSALVSGECPVANGAMAAPVDAPAQTVCPAYSCPEDPGSTTAFMPPNSGQAGYPYAWNQQPAFGSYNGAVTHGGPDDNSIYHLAMLKFVQTGVNALRIDVIETPVMSRLNGLLSHTDDLFGDGLQDLVTNVGCTNVQVTNGVWSYPACSVVTTDTGVTYGPTTLPDDANTPTTNFSTNAVLYVNLNQGPGSGGASFMAKSKPFGALGMKALASAALAGVPVIPGLINQSTNGLADTATWAHFPLAYPITVGGLPLYSLPTTNGYIDSRHYYFESSMPVVIQMTQSSGTGLVTGIRNGVYGYAEAMYNHYGRGFQGFHTISSISGDTVDGTERFTRTATTFNQRFPLVGKIASQTASTQDSIGTLHQVKAETDQWICTRSNRSIPCPQGDTLPIPTATTITSSGTAAYQPLLDNQSVKTYDIGTGTQMAQVDTVNAASVGAVASGWDNYSCGSGSLPFGNLNDQIVTTSDKITNIFVTSHTAQTHNCYDTTGSSAWWIDKLTNSTVTSSIAYAAGHALPTGTSAPSQSVSTALTYNADRTPLTKSVQSGIVNQQSTTTYCYPGMASPCPTIALPSYGLPSQVSVNAPDLSVALSPTRTTSYTYTKNGTAAALDGYFVYGTTDALGKVTTTSHQTNDGQVLTATDPKGVQVVAAYDPFGRATQVSHLGSTGVAFESPVKVAYTKCSGGATCAVGLIGEDVFEANSAYRVTTTQDGFPTKVTWFDLLGRQIKNAEGVYSGVSGGALTYKFSATSTIYDQNGTVAMQYAPYFVGTTPAYVTSIDYDALNRPTVKVEPRSDLDSLHGNLETDYTYNGRQTTILAHATSVIPSGGACPTASATNLCLQMTRSTNALGQLMQTTELPVLVPGTRRTLATNYWTEPQRHVVAITDAEGNITSASYNALGQRTQSKDPDQGTWSFSYDAFGELLTQTDARLAVSSAVARDGLGRTTQRQTVPPASVPGGMASDTTFDQWGYDPTTSLLTSVLRRRGTNSVSPSSNPLVWQETYTYEAATFRPSTTTTTITEGTTPQSNLFSQTVYDTSGRVMTHQYPSGLIVQHRYTAYGQLDALSNAGTGYVYWVSLGQNQWQHTVSEQFPGVITGMYVDYGSTGRAQTLGWTGTTADQMTYAYDSFGNLTKQTRAVPYSNNETYTYDAVQRLTQASRATGNIVSYGYSDSGNLTSKTDFGSYSYGAINSRTSGCGPHAVYAVGSTSYNCDTNGNVIGGSTLTTTFDVNNQARTAARSGSGSITWAYNALGERDYESDGTERYFVGDEFRIEGANKRHELGPVIVTRNGGTDTIAVALRDRLGSTLNIIDNGGAPVARQYDAFGKPRNGDMTDRAPATLALQPPTIFGFTDHEHDDSVLLIHMKGRVFDYQLGRFLSVDPLIGNPMNSQSINPYSYIGNNPLSGTDPTGYAACGEEIKDGDVCTVDKTETYHDSRSADPFSKTTVTTTWTIAQNGATTFATPSSGKGAFQALENAINGAGLARADGPTVGPVPMKIEETSASNFGCAKLGTGCEATQHLVEAGAPSSLATTVGNWVGAMSGPTVPMSSENPQIGVYTNPWTGREIANPQAEREGLFATLAGILTIPLGGEGVLARGVQAELRAAGPLAGNGASLDRLTVGEIQRIQNAANRSGQEINLVGSRAAGTARVGSDWDYVISANARTRNSLSRSLPGAGDLKEGLRPNIDVFKGQVEPGKPYVRFTPEGQ